VPYCSVQDVEHAAGGNEKLEQLSDLEEGGQVDEALVEAKIDEAESIINGYLQPRYTVPVDDLEVTPMLRRITARLTVHLLKEDREALTDQDMVKHERMLEQFDQVRQGRLTLGLDPRQAKSSSVVPAVGNREDMIDSLTRAKFGGWT
jgi:phage gp36-like protein